MTLSELYEAVSLKRYQISWEAPFRHEVNLVIYIDNDLWLQLMAAEPSEGYYAHDFLGNKGKFLAGYPVYRVIGVKNHGWSIFEKKE